MLYKWARSPGTSNEPSQGLSRQRGEKKRVECSDVRSSSVIHRKLLARRGGSISFIEDLLLLFDDV